ncbi:MAG TPA: acyl-CoA dehydrogenase family protein [Kofleriaceae bacterium]|nr:acyl-CoA dehydrogenase family protein [Kofleriaceae bacterium]
MGFREELRAWLEASCPSSMRTPMAAGQEVWGGRRRTFPSEDAKLWFERCVERGYTVPSWPVEYGGAGLSPDDAKIFAEELKRIGARLPLVSFGIWMLGPVLLELASETQKREHLPKIARGEIRWCQGYSEPGAGSDLASLSTRARREGDDYVVDGAKVWTSHADHADWMFCLVRTDADGPKHEGISFLLIDMASPGISVRPIPLISGSSPFCETRFDGVRVPAANLVGREGGGWQIAKRLLEHERTIISVMRDAAPEETETLPQQFLRAGSPAGLRDRVIQAELDFLCNRLTLERNRAAPGVASSMFKLYGTELNKRRKELRVLLAGTGGLEWNTAAKEWLRSRANSIEGGTSEIQLNIIAKRVLGLPD